MTPPPSSEYSVRPPLVLTEDELRRFRWFGWSMLGILVLSWAGWVSLLVIAHSSEIATITDREATHHAILKDSIDEIKADVKQLLKEARFVPD